MVCRSISVSTSISICNNLSVRSGGYSVETAKSDFMILVKLDVSIQQNVKLGSILRLLQCGSVREAVVNVEG